MASTPKRPTGSNVQRNSPDSTEHINTNHQGHRRSHALAQRLGLDEEGFHSVSPLAQVFVPLQVDDNEVSHQPAQTPPGTGISYGPATRRRIPSMVYRRMSGDHIPHRPVLEEGLGIRRPMSGHASRGSERHSPDDEPNSAIDFESGEDQLGGSLDLERRLAGIEERQKRIEDMVIQLIER